MIFYTFLPKLFIFPQHATYRKNLNIHKYNVPIFIKYDPRYKKQMLSFGHPRFLLVSAKRACDKKEQEFITPFSFTILFNYS